MQPGRLLRVGSCGDRRPRAYRRYGQVVRLLSQVLGIERIGNRCDVPFEDSADLESFLHRAGFELQVCSQVDKTPSFSTIAALELSPTVIERMRPVLRLWVMTPSLAGPGVQEVVVG